MNKIFFHLHSSGSILYIYLRNALVERQSAQSLANLFSLRSRKVHRIFGQRKKNWKSKWIFGGVRCCFYRVIFFSHQSRTISSRCVFFAHHISTAFARIFMKRTHCTNIFPLSAGIRLCVYVCFVWLALRTKTEWKNDPCLFVYRINNSVHR